ncbi:MAG TPA: trigger factor, partial [Pirellulaceae bacterium]
PDFDFEAIELPDQGPMLFEFNLEVRPEFELPEWKGLSIQRPTRTVTEADVDKGLERWIQTKDTEPTDEPVKLGYTLVADLESQFQGERVAQQEAVTIYVRSDLSFPDGTWHDFGKLVQGHRAGDRCSGRMMVSKDAADERYRGEEVEITVEILQVRKPIKTTETLWRELNFPSEDALRGLVRESLMRQMRYEQDRRIREQITLQLTEAASWELPPDLLRRQASRELDRAVMELRSSGFSESQIASKVNQLRQQSQTATARALKEHFVLERIAETEGVDAEDDDFEAEIEALASQAGQSIRATRARLEKRGLVDVMRNQIVERKVIDLIREHARFTDVAYKPDEQSVTALEDPITGTGIVAIPVAKHSEDARDLAQPTEHL